MATSQGLISKLNGVHYFGGDGSLNFHEVVMVIRVRDFRSVKPKAECCIGLKKLRHALAEDRSNQDIGIQNDHLSERQPFFGASA